MSAIPLKSRKAVHERSGGICECVKDNGIRCTQRATEIHHKKKRSSGGKKAQKALHHPDNLVDCCKADHDLIERHFWKHSWTAQYRISRFKVEKQ